MIAQMQNVEPGFLHQFLMVCIGLVAGVAAAVGIYRSASISRSSRRKFRAT